MLNGLGVASPASPLAPIRFNVSVGVCVSVKGGVHDRFGHVSWYRVPRRRPQPADGCSLCPRPRCAADNATSRGRAALAGGSAGHKDLQRAAFALSMRRLEIKLQELKDKHACQLAELGRKTDVVNQLRMETDGLRDLLRKAEHISICTTNEARELRRLALSAAIGPGRDDGCT